MSRRHTRNRQDALQDALIASERILTWTSGKTLADYRSDAYFHSAIERQIEILSEAPNILDRSDETFRDSIPEVGEIIGMRNVIAHGYFVVQDSLVWDALQALLPSVTDRILTLTRGEHGSSSGSDQCQAAETSSFQIPVGVLRRTGRHRQASCDVTSLRIPSRWKTGCPGRTAERTGCSA